MASITADTALSLSFLVKPVFSATTPIRSALVNEHSSASLAFRLAFVYYTDIPGKNQGLYFN
jgi:hypothetical protein